MNLLDNLEKDLADAMRMRDEFKVGVLRLLKSALKNYSIETGHELSMAETVSVLQKEAKKRTDAAKTYADAGRADRADEEIKEEKIISRYLPAQLSDYELDKLISETIKEVNAQNVSDMGRVMAKLMPKLNGRADGARVSGAVSQKLSTK